MRRRIGFVWAVAGSLGFALLLAIASSPNLKLADAVGMSAPPARTATIESASSTRVLPSQFDWHVPVYRVHRVSLALEGSPTQAGTQHTGAFPPQYSPLYRRPPPSLS